MIRALLDLFGFLTILPAGMPKDLEEVARNMFLFPIVGAVLGFLGGASVLFFSLFLPVNISSTIGFFSLLILTGLHHLDGLLDFGDALVFRGTKERRREVIHDTSTGAGGFVAGFFVTATGILATYEFILAGGRVVVFFVVSESLAKLAMVVAAGFGRVAFDGMGSVFVKTLKKSRWQILLAFIIAGMIVIPLIGTTGSILLAVSVFSALVFVWASNMLIGGISGDVFGALNEVTRVLCMLVMLWML
jgi:adenosylcobinamide-GDP ribazoletransferase